ncbi:MAG: DNA helicase II, partial [Alphaproteobacteria bacterium]
ILSFAANRRLHGSWTPAIPSRFIDELPKEHIEVESDQGLYGAPVPGAGSGFGGGGNFTEWGMNRWSPGMARARQHQPEGAAVITATGRVVENDPAGGFTRGARVFHRKFGYGTVAKVEGDRLDIDFDQAGRKKVIASFVVPEDQAS